MKVNLTGDLVGILEHLSSLLKLTPEEILLQTILSHHPQLFKELQGIDSLNVCIQLNQRSYDWIESLMQQHQITDEELMIHAILGLY